MPPILKYNFRWLTRTIKTRTLRKSIKHNIIKPRLNLVPQPSLEIPRGGEFFHQAGAAPGNAGPSGWEGFREGACNVPMSALQTLGVFAVII